MLFRSGEKEILVFLIGLADDLLPLFDMNFKVSITDKIMSPNLIVQDARKHLGSLPKAESYREYATHVILFLIKSQT